MPHPLAYVEHLRTWTNNMFTREWNVRLDLYDTGRTRDGKSELRYALAFIPEPPTDMTRHVVTFDGDDFWPSPLHAIDSDATAAALLTFFAADGETARFATEEDLAEELRKYTETQRELLAAVHEDISLWSEELDPQ